MFKIILTVCISVVLLAAVIAGSVSYHMTTVTVRAFESGYERRAVTGSNYVTWQKVRLEIEESR